MTKRILIDSHVLIWLLFEEKEIGRECRAAIERADQSYISIASLWELTLKHNKGQLDYSPADMLAGYKAMGLELVNITEEHIMMTSGISLPHKDPFDTMLIAQAKAEDLVLVTADRQLLHSNYPTLDCRA